MGPRTMGELGGRLEDLRRSVEREIGQRIVVRGVRVPDPDFRGRISQRASPAANGPDRTEQPAGYVLIEVQAAAPGYFWDAEIVEALLWRVAAGERSAVVSEADLRADRLWRRFGKER